MKFVESPFQPNITPDYSVDFICFWLFLQAIANFQEVGNSMVEDIFGLIKEHIWSEWNIKATRHFRVWHKNTESSYLHILTHRSQPNFTGF
jgi:hypothetical protein